MRGKRQLVPKRQKCCRMFATRKTVEDCFLPEWCDSFSSRDGSRWIRCTDWWLWALSIFRTLWNEGLLVIPVDILAKEMGVLQLHGAYGGECRTARSHDPFESSKDGWVHKVILNIMLGCVLPIPQGISSIWTALEWIICQIVLYAMVMLRLKQN